MGIVVAESVAGDVGADFADAGATGLVGAAGLEGGGMRNLLELVLDECDAEGRKGLAWVGEATTRQVLTEGEGNWISPPTLTVGAGKCSLSNEEDSLHADTWSVKTAI